jgi:hypothetical protein
MVGQLTCCESYRQLFSRNEHRHDLAGHPVMDALTDDAECDLAADMGRHVGRRRFADDSLQQFELRAVGVPAGQAGIGACSARSCAARFTVSIYNRSLSRK